MATATLGDSLSDTTNTTAYTSNSFTPAAGDLLVLFAHQSGAVSSVFTITDSQSGTWTKVGNTITRSSTATAGGCWIRDSTVSATAMTVTITYGTSGTGNIMFVWRIAGMSKTGATAARQTANQNNQASGGTPAPAFAVSADTNNVTLGVVFNATNPAGLTPPTSWTEPATPAGDIGHGTPAAGGETVNRDSGFTGTTITWGSTSASVFCDFILELDTSSASAPGPVLRRPRLPHASVTSSDPWAIGGWA